MDPRHSLEVYDPWCPDHEAVCCSPAPCHGPDAQVQVPWIYRVEEPLHSHSTLPPFLVVMAEPYDCSWAFETFLVRRVLRRPSVRDRGRVLVDYSDDAEQVFGDDGGRR